MENKTLEAIKSMFDTTDQVIKAISPAKFGDNYKGVCLMTEVTNKILSVFSFLMYLHSQHCTLSTHTLYPIQHGRHQGRFRGSYHLFTSTKKEIPENSKIHSLKRLHVYFSTESTNKNAG
jgi:hypothetical protein